MAELASITQAPWAPHKGNIQKLANSIDYLFGKITQPSESRLSETAQLLDLQCIMYAIFVCDLNSGIGYWNSGIGHVYNVSIYLDVWRVQLVQKAKI